MMMMMSYSRFICLAVTLFFQQISAETTINETAENNSNCEYPTCQTIPLSPPISESRVPPPSPLMSIYKAPPPPPLQTDCPPTSCTPPTEGGQPPPPLQTDCPPTSCTPPIEGGQPPPACTPLEEVCQNPPPACSPPDNGRQHSPPSPYGWYPYSPPLHYENQPPPFSYYSTSPPHVCFSSWLFFISSLLFTEFLF